MEDDFLGPRSSGKFPEATEHLKRKSRFSDGIFQTEAGGGFLPTFAEEIFSLLYIGRS